MRRSNLRMLEQTLDKQSLPRQGCDGRHRVGARAEVPTHEVPLLSPLEPQDSQDSPCRSSPRRGRKGTSTMKQSRARRGGRLVLVAVLAVVLAACTMSGGRTDMETEDGSGGGAGDNSGYTIAMITHETPGDTFWDKIKSGAQQAAQNYGIDLKYSNDPEASKQATLIQNASRLEGRRHRDHAGDPGRPGRRRSRTRTTPRSRWWRSTLGSRPVPGCRRLDVLRLRREPGRRDLRVSGSPRRAGRTRSA